MGVFEDKKFEELDWISQATEPIDSKMNEILSLLPDIVNIDYKTYIKMLNNSWDLRLSIDRAVTYLFHTHIPGTSISYEQQSALANCFKFDFSGDDIILNFEEEAILGGSFALIKTTFTMDEKVLEHMLGREGMNTIRCCNFPQDSVSRANEILELLGNCQHALKTRSTSQKRRDIYRRLDGLFKTNEWKIKDTELANKVGFWIKDYIVDGNLAAFSNFCRLKVMTHKGQPIYSMEEVT